MTRIALLLLACVATAGAQYMPRMTSGGASTPITVSSATENELITLNGVGTQAPLEIQFSTGGTFNTVPDDLFIWKYNDAGTAAAQPKYSENFESRFVEDPGGTHPLGLMERHGNYTNIARNVSYRPWGWAVDLATSDADWFYKGYQWAFSHRSGTQTDFSLTGASTGVLMSLSNRSTGTTMLVDGGDTARFNLNTSFPITRYAAATVGAPTLDSPLMSVTGKYWTGATSANADSGFQTKVTGNNTFYTEFGPTANPWKITQAGNLASYAVAYANATELITLPNAGNIAALTTGNVVKQALGMTSGNRFSLDATDLGVVIGTGTGSHLYFSSAGSGAPQIRGQYDANDRYLVINGGSGGAGDNTLYLNLGAQSSPITAYGPITAANNDLTFNTVSKGPVIKSADGNRWRIVADNSGVLSAVDLDP